MSVHRRLVGLVVAALLTAGLVPVTADSAAAAQEIYPAPASGQWTMDGRAWGHGRGMSQWGAQGAALQGLSAAQILGFYYPGTTTASIAGQYVTAALSDFTPVTTVTVWSPEGRNIRMGPIGGEQVLPAGRWTVTVSGQQVTAQRRDTVGGPVTETRTYTGVLRFESQQEYGMIIAHDASATEGRWYRGDLRIVPTSGTGFNVTNWLPVEDYLKSVVPRESPASWQPAALQAQAVAARSYAWYKNVHGSTLCDTTACQVYYGKGKANAAGTLTTSYEDSRTDAAIAATAGQVRYWDGQIALTEFSSSNGGWTTPGAVPYQVSKYDPYSGTAPGDTKTRWATTVAVSTVARYCPGGTGTVKNLVVLSRTGYGELGGRVTSARVECTTGTATLSSLTFGGAVLSTWWKPRPTTPELVSPQVSATTINAGGQMSIGVTANVGLRWTLTVTDRSTGRRAQTVTGTALAGTRFNATWLGTYSPRAAGESAYVGAGVYDLALSAVDDAGARTATFRTAVTVRRPADPPTVAAVPLVGNTAYVPLTPTRLVDTRTTFQSLGAGQRADITVLGRAGVPSTGVSAVVLNLTAVVPNHVTHLRAWPAGAPRPNASVLNTSPGRTQAAMVTVAVGGGGKVSLYNAAGTTHYIVDVLGYYTTNVANGARYTPVAPIRALDTRGGAALTSGRTATIRVASLLGQSAAGVSAVALNLTTTRAQGNGYAVAFGSGALPSSSTVNLVPGEDVANRVVVPVVNGVATVAVQGGPAHVVVDVVGWYGAVGGTSGALFTPVQPARLLDTRTTRSFGPGEQRSLVVTGGSIPAGATAVAGTLTAVNASATATHARVWPAGLPLTPTSDLNTGRGRTTANAVMVRIGSGGAVRLYNDQGTCDLLLDVMGYFR